METVPAPKAEVAESAAAPKLMAVDAPEVTPKKMPAPPVLVMPFAKTMLSVPASFQK